MATGANGAAGVSVPPAIVTGPEAAPKRSERKAWAEPSTARVPAASPCWRVPNTRSSASVVWVTVGTDRPVASPLQKGSTPHVPPAVPKPSAAPLVSQ